MIKNVGMRITWFFTLCLGVCTVFLFGVSNAAAWHPSHAQYSKKLSDQPQGIMPGRLAVSSTVTSNLALPLVLREGCSPAIDFTSVPLYGSLDDLQGQVSCGEPAEYQVAVYIFVGGWWTKPYWDSPLTPIQADGSWTCDITTGGNDPYATQIAAFLLPNGYNPPILSGEQVFPTELLMNSVDHLIIDRSSAQRTISFSGLTWNVKKSDIPAGPGPNYFSDQEQDLWVDQDGRLHMKIVNRDGRWYSTEVYTQAPLEHGTYTFTLASPVDQLDPNVVLGLFTWDNAAPQYNFREIDIEFSRWGDVGALNSQYVVQPWDHPGNMHRFNTILDGTYSTHRFSWASGSVQFSSFQGKSPNLGNLIDEWSYTGPDIPPSGEGNARINLWLMNGLAPSDGQEVEVIIDAFQYSP